MEKPTIIIEIEGGNLQRVSSTIPIFYYLIDRDNINAGDKFPELTDYMEEDDIISTDTRMSIAEHLKSYDR